MVRLVSARFLVTALIVLLAPAIALAEYDPSKDPEGFKKDVMAAISSSSSKWEGVRFDKISKGDLRLTLLYKKMPSGMPEVERDTKAVARAVLKVLTDKGRNPHKEWVFLFVHAHKPEKGETGAELVRTFGKTSYDFNTDSLKFTPAR